MSAYSGCRATLAVLLAILALTGCAGPRLEVAAAPSQASVTLTDAEIQLTLRPNTWNGYPSDLARHYTPVQVQIENNRTDEVRLRYSDFLAVDDARNQYQAVPPAEVARALFGAGWRYRGLLADSGRQLPPHPLLFAESGSWWPYGYWPYRPWYPYHDPFLPDPFYSDSPSWWYRRTGYDILTQGLRDGRVLPGARVQGFLYLQLATQEGSLLTLTWTPVSADGKPLTTLSTQFRIVR